MTYAIVNEAAGYAYVNLAKCGCTSIKLAIAAHLGEPFEDIQWESPWRMSGEEIADRHDLCRFTFVRHPALRLVSCWADWCQPPYPSPANYARNFEFLPLKGIGFEEFVRCVAERVSRQPNHHYAPLWPQLHAGGRLIVDEIYKLRDIRRVWPQLQDRFDLPAIRHARRSRHAPWWTYYTPELREIVEMAYEEDFREFGYSWESNRATEDAAC